MIGTSQTRILDLFRKSLLYKSLDGYLDYLRILRSMYYLMSKREWNVAACAQQAGFTAIRSFNRKFQDAIGMTPPFEFINPNNNQVISKGVLNDIKVKMGRTQDAATTSLSTGDAKLQ
jgi:AraC-like DNA-binding protein